MAAPLTIWVGNDTPIKVIGLRESVNGALQNNLTTVSVSIRDDDGVALSPAVNVTMSFISGSDGDYLGTIPYTASLTAGKNYKIFVEANAGANMVGHWEIRAVARARTE